MTTHMECPYCLAALFHLQAQAPGVNAIHVDDPTPEREGNGWAVTCPTCSRRVELVYYPAVGGHPGAWRIAPGQGRRS